MDGPSIVEDPSFRIISTLKNILFNSEDIRQGVPPVRTWKEKNGRILVLHRQRLHAAAQACSWPDVCTQLDNYGADPELEQAIDDTSAQHPEPEKGHVREMRVRILIDREGKIEAESVPMGNERPLQDLETNNFHSLPLDSPPLSLPLNVPCSTVSIDPVPTTPSLYTSHKTTHRQPYDAARARAGITKCPPGDREVLLFNDRHEIMEASLSAVYFYRDGRWVLPASTAGGMLSVTRLWALGAGVCTEEVVTLEDVRDGEIVWLSNALRGFFRGRISGSGFAPPVA